MGFEQEHGVLGGGGASVSLLEQGELQLHVALLCLEFGESVVGLVHLERRFLYLVYEYGRHLN